MTALRMLATLVMVVGVTTTTYAVDDDTDKPIQKPEEDISQGAASVDPGGLLMLEAIGEDGSTAPLIINGQGTALMRGSAGVPATTLGIVEGSRIPIPRESDGSCPNVKVTLSDTLEADQPVIFWDPENRPRSFLAADVRTAIDHQIDPAACEVVITSSRGYITYRKRKVKKHLSGKALRMTQEDGVFAEPVYPDVPLPTPTPDPSRAAATRPPGAPDPHPAFRATTAGTIERVPVEEPRSDESRGARQLVVFNNQCILYEFDSWARRRLWRYSATDPTRYGPYALNKVHMQYYDYPWRSYLRYTRLLYNQEAILNYYVSPRSFTFAWYNGYNAQRPQAIPAVRGFLVRHAWRSGLRLGHACVGRQPRSTQRVVRVHRTEVPIRHARLSLDLDQGATLDGRIRAVGV